MDNKRVLSDDEPSAMNTNQATGLIGQIELASVKLLSARLRSVFDAANSELMDLANKPDNTQESEVYMEGARTLGKQRQGIEETFIVQLGEAFTGFSQGLGAKQSDATDDDFNSDEMSLVDESELEESLALITMAERAITRYPQELYAIEQRFDAIVGEFDVEVDQIPIAPRMVSRIFGESVKRLEVDAKVKLIIYELFNEHILTNLQPLYDEINSLFIKANVLPKLKRKVKKQESELEEAAPAPVPPPAQELPQDGWWNSEEVTPAQQSFMAGGGLEDAMPSSYLLDTMEQLVSNQLPGELTPSGRRTLASEEMMQALSNVQFDSSTVDSSLTVKELKTSLLGEMGALKRAGEYSPLDRSIIDIVTLLFDYILDDDNLPSAAKAILARLQMPMLKVAMLDSELFSSKQHIARQLLDKMAKAVVGLAEDANGENSPVIKKIEETVVRVLNEFSDDMALFEELLKDFDAYLEQQKSEEEAARQEGLARLKEKEERAQADVKVMDYLASYIEGQDMPRPVYELLEGLWKEVMITTYLNDGIESEQWKENLRFIDELLWSVNPDKNEADKKRMGGVILKIISAINKAAEEIKFPKEKLDKILGELGEFHILILHNDESIKSTAAVRIKVDPERENKIERESKEDISRELDAMRESLAQVDDMDTILSEAFDGIKADKKTPTNLFTFDDDNVEEVDLSVTPLEDKRKPVVDDEYWRMVLDLDAGQWISLTEKDGQIKRVKLAWKSDMLGECTFINWRFKVVADLNFNQLAARFRNGKAALVDSLPLFERAFDTVMNKLQKGTSLLNAPQAR